MFLVLSTQLVVIGGAEISPPLHFLKGTGAISGHSVTKWMARDQWCLVPVVGGWRGGRGG